MVADRLLNAHLYTGLGGGIAAALDLIRTQDFSALAVGKYEVKGPSLYYLVQSYTTRTVEQSAWEAHNNYLDVQYLVKGRERIGWAPRSSLKSIRAYDATTDAELLSGNGDFLTAESGTFLLLWPEDAHMPGIAAGAPSTVLKVVVKVLL